MNKFVHNSYFKKGTPLRSDTLKNIIFLKTYIFLLPTYNLCIKIHFVVP